MGGAHDCATTRSTSSISRHRSPTGSHSRSRSITKPARCTAHEPRARCQCASATNAIHEVRLWDCGRSAAQIAAARNAVLTSADWSNLIGYWRFEEGAGTATADATSTTDGVLLNGPVWVDGAPLHP